MSSEPEENADRLNESNAEPSAYEVDVPSVPKDNALNEHAKPKRRRRGKKRKHRKESAATCESENLEESAEIESEHEIHDSPTWDSDEDLSCDVNSFNDVIIRPINVPKAPENSTQFIMDDHNECRLYMSFETPNPYLADPRHPEVNEGDIVEPIGEDAAYRDIDYEYESPQDFDNSAYYDREFEQSYKNNRFDELMRLPRTELIGMLHSLESRSKELNDDLVKENPSPMLDKLQHELLELQEKHNVLQEYNSKLTALVMQHEDVADPAPESTVDSVASQEEPVLQSEEDPGEEYVDLCRAPVGDTRISSESDSGDDLRCENYFSCVESAVRESSEYPNSEPSLSGVGSHQLSGSHSGSSNARGVSSNNDDCSKPDVYIETRQANNVESVILNVAFQEKCATVALRDEELSASKTSVI